MCNRCLTATSSCLLAGDPCLTFKEPFFYCDTVTVNYPTQDTNYFSLLFVPVHIQVLIP